MSHGIICGRRECVECYPRVMRLLAPPRPREAVAVPGMPAPTVKSLEKHAARYGPEGVLEVAAELGLTVNVEGAESKVAKKPPATPRKERIRQYLELGYSWDVIGEELDVSPRVLRELKAKWEADEAATRDRKASGRTRSPVASRVRAVESVGGSSPSPSVDEKTCRTCSETKPAADFARNRASSDGLYHECKACEKAKRDAKKAAK